MLTILVDSNVLLDILTEDPQWWGWSGETLSECAESSALAINPLIYAEVSIRFEGIEDLQDALPEEDFLRLPLPWEAPSSRASASFATGGVAVPGDRPCPASTLALMRPFHA